MISDRETRPIRPHPGSRPDVQGLSGRLALIPRLAPGYLSPSPTRDPLAVVPMHGNLVRGGQSRDIQTAKGRVAVPPLSDRLVRPVDVVG
jgi:hypothetical protein